MYDKTNINNKINLYFKKTKPVFSTNKIFIQCIKVKLKKDKNENKENLIYNNSNRNNFIYHKKSLKYICKGDKNKYHNDENFKVNLRKIMSHNNKNKTYKRKSNLITEYKTINNSSTLFPEVPYIKAGNIFFRNRCQFSKNKSINNNKRDFQRSKSCELLNINIKKRSIDRIKELEVENYHLKKMIRISEKKLNEKKKELEKILILQNIYNQNEKRKYDISPIPNMQFKKYKYIIKEVNKYCHLINYIDKFDYILNDYLEEPKEQIAPIPYSINNK